MAMNTVPWVRSRGLGRLLAQETNVSDLIQYLSDRDPSPWVDLVGFVPHDVTREVSVANNADLLLSSNSNTAVVEVKLGHLMSVDQQEKYEALIAHPDLYLAVLSADEVRLAADTSRWSFLGLGDLVGSWEMSNDELARRLAIEAADVLRNWDRMISDVLGARFVEGGAPLSVLNQKFLARVVTRHVAKDLRDRGRRAWAGVTSGGGLPLIQSWTPSSTRAKTEHSWQRSAGGRRSRVANCVSVSTSPPAGRSRGRGSAQVGVRPGAQHGQQDRLRGLKETDHAGTARPRRAPSQRGPAAPRPRETGNV